MVSMVAFQAVDPGSIPGHRIFLTFVTQFLTCVNFNFVSFNTALHLLQKKISPSCFQTFGIDSDIYAFD